MNVNSTPRSVLKQIPITVKFYLVLNQYNLQLMGFLYFQSEWIKLAASVDYLCCHKNLKFFELDLKYARSQIYRRVLYIPETCCLKQTINFKKKFKKLFKKNKK